MGHSSLVQGKDQNGVVRPILVDETGKVVMDATFTGDITLGTVAIDQSTPNANEVVVISVPLATDAATETSSAAILAKLTSDPATATLQTSTNSKLDSINGKITAVNTGAVTVASSALPTGAATQTTLASIDGKVTACNTGAVVISSGTVTASTATASLANSTAYETSRVVKASAGTLLSLTGYNSGPAQFLQVFNSTTVPANGVAPVLVVAVPATSSFAFEWRNGVPLSTGISISNSSTGPTKTIGSADCYFTATYL